MALTPDPPFVVLVRHAKAVDRGTWDDDDALRPLAPRGRAQAEWLAHELVRWPHVRIISSRAVRCRETVAPLARAWGSDISQAEWLYEGAGSSGAEVLWGAAEDGVVACSHGDVLPELAASWSRRTGVRAPAEEWQTGVALVLAMGDRPSAIRLDPRG